MINEGVREGMECEHQESDGSQEYANIGIRLIKKQCRVVMSLFMVLYSDHQCKVKVGGKCENWIETSQSILTCSQTIGLTSGVSVVTMLLLSEQFYNPNSITILVKHLDNNIPGHTNHTHYASSKLNIQPQNTGLSSEDAKKYSLFEGLGHLR